MTTITIDRAVVEQALHVAENAGYPLALIKALRAALEEPQTTHSTDALRTFAQQALEALKDDQYRLVEVGSNQYDYKTDLAIAALERALAHQAKAWVCPESPEHRYTKPGHCEDCGKTLVLAQQAEPVEPVAWLYTGIKQDGTEHGPHFVWKPEYMDAMSASKGAKATPLYFAPPQRKPLSEGALMGVYIDFDRTADTAWSGVEYLLRLCRAVERAHGITDPQIADRLARHGIPMPDEP